MNCVTWVVFPQPVSPLITVTRLLFIRFTSSCFQKKIKRFQVLWSTTDVWSILLSLYYCNVTLKENIMVTEETDTSLFLLILKFTLNHTKVIPVPLNFTCVRLIYTCAFIRIMPPLLMRLNKFLHIVKQWTWDAFWKELKLESKLWRPQYPCKKQQSSPSHWSQLYKTYMRNAPPFNLNTRLPVSSHMKGVSLEISE